jgi:cell division protein FtsL
MQRSPRWGQYVALAVVGLGLALAQVWVRLQVVAVGYALSNARQLVATLEGERQALEAQWRALTAPARLAELATQRLGLAAPRPEQVVRVP